jgi:hypothetical protein
MAVENLKATAITNADASPIVSNAAGVGAPGIVREVDGYVTISASASAASTYRLVRVPTNAKIKSITLESEAQGAGKINLSVYYSDSTTDGTPPAKTGVIVPTTGDQFFASDVDLASAVTPTNVTNESGNYTLDLRQQPLWKALALTTDPGGFFDIVAVVHTTAITTGTGKTGIRVAYID